MAFEIMLLQYKLLTKYLWKLHTWT